MKSRTSFFDGATFKKDITRFIPLWGLYTVGMLLIMLSTVSSSFVSHPARQVSSSLGALALANLIYGALTAQLLFGDLFQSRLCNALHAMPATRAARFGSHVTAGLLFALIPNWAVSLLMIPYLDELWYTTFYWFGGMQLQYLFFFGAGVLSVMCTGSRFAMVVVFSIINFLSMAAYWFVEVIFTPMMPGVLADDTLFKTLCPLVQLIGNNDYFRINIDRFAGFHHAEFAGLGNSWLYLFILAGVGIAALIFSLLLYRRRKLESAGDFMAVKWLSPIFLVLYTLCAGAFLSIFGELFGSGKYVIFLIVGLIIGFFTGRMLLERTIRVFRGKNFLQLALLTAVVFLALWVVKTDLFGIVRYVPDPNDVVTITYNTQGAYGAVAQEEEYIETICKIHRLASEDYCDRSCGKTHYYIHMEYHLLGGRTVKRVYYLCEGSEAATLLSKLPSIKK